ncbi:MAG: autotransporter outer membrane beta-barrel domain-containing protein, partial [Pseudomonadota bacterium]
SWSIALGGDFTSRVLLHREQSSDAGYASIGEDVRLAETKFSLNVFKEFFNQQIWSVTVRALGGLSDGSYESDGDNLSEFEETLSSVHFGAGVALNYNFYVYGLKLQPYVEVDLIQEVGETQLSHVNGGNQLRTTIEFSDTVAQAQVGLRSYDSEVGLMSFIALSSPFVMSESQTINIFVNEALSSGTLTTPTQVDRAPVVFSLGMGAYF